MTKKEMIFKMVNPKTQPQKDYAEMIASKMKKEDVEAIYRRWELRTDKPAYVMVKDA